MQTRNAPHGESGLSSNFDPSVSVSSVLKQPLLAHMLLSSLSGSELRSCVVKFLQVKNQKASNKSTNFGKFTRHIKGAWRNIKR